MTYTEVFDKKKNEVNNIFANVIRIAGNIESVSIDTIDGYAKPEQGKTAILKLIDEIKQKLETI